MTDVTVYSDRAAVTRKAEVRVDGSSAFVLGPLPPGTDTRSIRLDAKGAAVQHVELTAFDPDEQSGATTAGAAVELAALNETLAKLRAELEAARAHRAVVERLTPRLPEARERQGPARLESKGWRSAAQFMTSALTDVMSLESRLAARVGELDRQTQLLSARAPQHVSAQAGQPLVTVTLRGQGAVTLALTYLVLGPTWQPTYDVELDPQSSKVKLSFAGIVQQQTGEDWEQTQLTLSTAVPSSLSPAPRLSRWTLGEADRFVPTPRAVPISPPPSLPTPPAPESFAPPRPRSRLSSRGVEAPASAPAPAVPSAPSEAFDAFEEIESLSRDTTAATLANQRAGASAGRVEPPASTMSLAAPAGYRRPVLPSSSPAARAGGHDLSYPSLVRETITSGGELRRIALFAEEWPVVTERTLYPAVSPEAFLVAELKSPSKRVLPSGQAQLSVRGEPSGKAELPLIVPGEPFSLPLGIDRGLKPVRTVRLSSAEEGLLTKSDVTEYQVTIEVPNPYRAKAAIVVHDQWPLSDDQNVEVKLLRATPPATHDAARGFLTWRLSVPAAGKAVVTFAYSIRRPKDWRLHQR